MIIIIYKCSEKKTCIITFLDENEAPRITDPTDIELTIYIYLIALL